MSHSLIYFNGIDDDTGDYFLQPQDVSEFLRRIEGREPESQGKARRLKFGHDPLDLAEAGWGVIWPESVDPAVREALSPLLAHRRAQATCQKVSHFQEITYLSDETTLEFWRRHGMGPNTIDPEKMPYYLLIVGDPREIPFDVQFELGMPHAAGRICFDSAGDYAAYARHVVEAESRPLPLEPTIAFWGVENPDDPPTRLSVEHLVKPVEGTIAEARGDWRVMTSLRRAATKEQLMRLFRNGESPSVLFTASHALRCAQGTDRQRTHQGALISADWPGREAWAGRGLMPDDFLFTAGDVTEATHLDGLVAFHFGCYSAGTPRLDPYSRREPVPAAPEPFVASLPKKMLRHGALAVIGHVDVALEQGFFWNGAGRQQEIFESALQAIMAGHPVGHAMDPFGDRLGILSNLLVDATQKAARRDSNDASTDDLTRFQLWAAYQDARNYLILGDPAARLNVERN